jgi:hypothetical protein
MKQITLYKRKHIGLTTTIVHDLTTSFHQKIGHSTKKEEIWGLNHSTDQMFLEDTCRLFHLQVKLWIFFSASRQIKIDLSFEAILNKYDKVQILSFIL